MSNIFGKIIVSVVLCVFVGASLISCNGGIDGDEAKAFVSDFFEALEADDYKECETFLHPERPADLKTFILKVEQAGEVDLSSDIEIEKYTWISSAYYDSSVDGSTYKMEILVDVGEDQVEFTIELVKNDNGFGIYNLDVDTTP